MDAFGREATFKTQLPLGSILVDSRVAVVVVAVVVVVVVVVAVVVVVL